MLAARVIGRRLPIVASNGRRPSTFLRLCPRQPRAGAPAAPACCALQASWTSSSSSVSSSDPDEDGSPHHDDNSGKTKKKKKRPRDNPDAVPASPLEHHLHEHHQPPAIDNSGILEEGEEAHQPPAVAVSGAPMLGGNVVWRASADHKERVARVGLWEKVNAQETAFKGSKEATTVRSGPIDSNFKSLGVIESNKELDLQLMISNYTVPALAAGLRDREETLQLCARLLADGSLEQLEKVLHPYQAGLINRRRRKTRNLDLAGGLTSKHLNMLRKYLQRSPRHLTRAVSLRASVIIPLCNVNGVASVLFERRSSLVRSFKNQVCFPGGMVEESLDVNIIETSLREMEEEIGFPAKSVDVLGVLRCDWSEVHKITGIGVTPVVGFLGDLTERKLSPNPDEVAECFTIPLAMLLEKEHWNYEEEKGTVVFVGGPHVIWGLTAHLLDVFLRDILLRYRINVK